MRGFVFVTKLWIFGLCWLSIACSDNELSFSNVEDNSKVKFSSGTKSGVVVNSSGNLTIDTGSLSGVSLDPSWTPKYDNIVGYWKMDGDWTDSSGNGNGGVASSGGATFNSSSLIGSAAGSFDGSSYVTTNNLNVSTSEITLSIWVNIDTFSTTRAPLFYRVAGDNLYPRLLVTNGHQLFFQYQLDGVTYAVISPSNIHYYVGQWNHVVATINVGTGSKIYVNGVQVGQHTTSGTNITSGINGMEMGRDSNLGDFLNGKIDEAVVWSKELSPDEVYSVYEKQRPKFSGELDSSWTPQWDSIVGYWKMDGNWLDSSGNENHGAVGNNAKFSSDTLVGSYSLELDGDSDFVRVPSSADLNPSSSMSISAWFKLDVVDSNTDFGNTILMKGDWNVADSYGIYLYSNNLRCALGQAWGISANYSDTNLQSNRWYHVVCVVDSTGHRLYVDGSLVDSNLNPLGSLSNGYDLRFGAHAVSSAAGDFDGQIDDVAIWNTDLTSSEVSEIYHRQKQKYAGSFTSHIFDFGTTGSWLGLDIVTPLPYMKELSGPNGSESSSVYSDLVGSTGSVGDDDLTDSLVGLWHLNGNSVDAIQGNNGTDTSVSYSAGLLKDAGMFNGSTSKVVIGNVLDMGISNFTLSGWFATTSNVAANNNGFIYKRATGNTITPGYQLNLPDGDVHFRLADGVSGAQAYLFSNLNDGQWHHVVAMRNSGKMQIYVDGELKLDIAESIGSIDSLVPLSIGALSTNSINIFHPFDGLIDEVAIWSRALTSSEILQLYRRGANRLKYQVRSCAQSDCSDGVWKGPGGDGTTYYSELFNRLSSNFNFSCTLNTTDSDSSVCVDDEISLLGSPLVIAPSLLFRDMAGSATLDRNRYFQFKVLMESDDENNLCSSSPCLPELKSLKVRHGP